MTFERLTVPSEELADAASEALDALRTQGSAGPLRVRATGDAEGTDVLLPEPVQELLLRVLAHLAEGSAVNVVPVQAELTTQQAADLLGVSRPHLVSLLEKGELPHRKVGTHRRVMARDVIAYKQRDDQRRREVARALTAEAQELGLEY